MSSCFIIAEIGINHNGDLDIAKKLIKLSKECGFNAVKFQKRDINIVYKEDFLNSYRESPWGKTQREQKNALEFSLSDYWEINDYCKEVDIDWSFSSWDENSQIEMRIFNTKWNKIASAMAVNHKFVDLVASEKKHTYMSTGMMTLEDIQRSLDIFNKHKCPVTLMHTVSTYPAKESTLNLRCIKTLKERFNIPVGYSGHESGVSPSVMAVVLGAEVIERHVTLDRAMYGSDQSASLEPSGMRSLVNTIRKVDKCMGDGVKKIIEEEKAIAKKLRYWND
tara:strand:+ start:5379 stop:6215 length:837 start_codon:yes stop_codon:yes gene_type:complete